MQVRAYGPGHSTSDPLRAAAKHCELKGVVVVWPKGQQHAGAHRAECGAHALGRGGAGGGGTSGAGVQGRADWEAQSVGCLAANPMGQADHPDATNESALTVFSMPGKFHIGRNCKAPVKIGWQGVSMRREKAAQGARSSWQLQTTSPAVPRFPASSHKEAVPRQPRTSPVLVKRTTWPVRQE
jgi:hypothetical protein